MKKNILAVIGSASKNSSNLKLVTQLAELARPDLDFRVYDRLQELPPFDPELSATAPPDAVREIRQTIAAADGVIICTPEYVFSIPSGLKNLVEWCVATTVFSGKPAGLITASANGEKGHEELKLIMRTIEARFLDDTTLLIKGIKGKIDEAGTIIDPDLTAKLEVFMEHFRKLVNREA